MSGPERGANGPTLVMFAAATILGGANFVAVRFSNQELAPFWGAGLRFALASTMFTGIALALRLRWPRGRQLALTAIYGALSFAIFSALIYWALVRVTAAVATVVIAAVPLATLLLAVAQRLERLRPRGAVGALLAVAGIAWMAVGPGQAPVPVSALLALTAAAVSMGQSIILGKYLSDSNPVMTNAVSMIVGTILLLGFSVLAGEAWMLPRQREAAWALAYLVTVGSLGLFILVLLVVRRWTASASSYMFVVFPVVTMMLDAWLASEPVPRQAATGAALVMFGVWVGALSPGASRYSGGPSPPA